MTFLCDTKTCGSNNPLQGGDHLFVGAGPSGPKG